MIFKIKSFLCLARSQKYVLTLEKLNDTADRGIANVSTAAIYYKSTSVVIFVTVTQLEVILHIDLRFAFPSTYTCLCHFILAMKEYKSW